MSNVSTPIPPTADDAEGATPDEEQRRRRKFAILFFLLLLLVLVLLLTVWYLIFRRPIEDIIPPITVERVPTYSFNISGLDRPIGVAVAADGSRIYVGNSVGDRLIHVYDGSGEEIAQLSPPGSSPGTRIPVYMALDPLTGDLYVADRQARAIHIYGADLRYTGKYAPDPAVGDWAPLGITFDSEGQLYVSDVAGDRHRVLVFDRSRTLIRTVGADDNLSYPNGLAVDADGSLLVVDGNNGRLLAFDLTGAITAIIPRGTAPGELGLPRGAAIDDKGRIYIADATSHVIQMYRLDAESGTLKSVGEFGHEGRGENAFAYPNGVATDTHQRIYVADWANDRLDVWSY